MQIRERALEFCEGGTKWFIHRLPHGQFALALTLGHVILGQTEEFANDISRNVANRVVPRCARARNAVAPPFIVRQRTFQASLYMWFTFCTRGSIVE